MTLGRPSQVWLIKILSELGGFTRFPRLLPHLTKSPSVTMSEANSCPLCRVALLFDVAACEGTMLL